jgi:hypothetical protein
MPSMNSIRSPRRWLTLFVLGLTGPGLLFQGCSQESRSGRTPAELKREARLERARSAREALARFYLPRFAEFINSGGYDAQRPVTRINHFANRLWVAERDWTYDRALDELRGVVQAKIMSLDRPGEEPREARLAHFRDEHQIFRDHYAMIMTEMFIDKLVDIPIQDFITSVRVEYASRNMSIHRHHPWTVTALTTTTPPQVRWPTASGKTYSGTEAIKLLLVEPFLPKSRDRFDFYDYARVYALGAAYESGYKQFDDSTRLLMRQLFEHAERVNTESRARGDKIEEVVGRIGVNGSLLAAYYRAGVELYPPAEYENHVDRALEGLARDAGILGETGAASFPVNAFEVLPQAIHGLDLALKRLNAPASP